MNQPRTNQSERAFRLLEPTWAEACNKSTFFDPERFKWTQSTAINRLTESRSGYILFKWQSEQIPEGYDLMQIKIKRAYNGLVLLENPLADALAKVQKTQNILIVNWNDEETRNSIIERAISDPAYAIHSNTVFQCDSVDQMIQACEHCSKKGVAIARDRVKLQILL